MAKLERLISLKNKLNFCRCRSRRSECSNTFEKYKSRYLCLKSKRACSTDCVCMDMSVEWSQKQQENSTRKKRENKKYVNKETTKHLEMQKEELSHTMWTHGEALLLYCIVQLLQNNVLEIITGIVHQLYSKLQEINRVGLNNRPQPLK